MLRTYHAVLQPSGQLLFLEGPVGRTNQPRHVLVTFTDDLLPADSALSGAALSEPTLAVDWLRDEEDAAWAHLQADR